MPTLTYPSPRAAPDDEQQNIYYPSTFRGHDLSQPMYSSQGAHAAFPPEAPMQLFPTDDALGMMNGGSAGVFYPQVPRATNVVRAANPRDINGDRRFTPYPGEVNFNAGMIYPQDLNLGLGSAFPGEDDFSAGVLYPQDVNQAMLHEEQALRQRVTNVVRAANPRSINAASNETAPPDAEKSDFPLSLKAALGILAVLMAWGTVTAIHSKVSAFMGRAKPLGISPAVPPSSTSCPFGCCGSGHVYGCYCCANEFEYYHFRYGGGNHASTASASPPSPQVILRPKCNFSF